MIETKISSDSLHTAVLFLVFNRPDTTKKVFNSIRIAKPPRLYIAADGPRLNKLGEVDQVEQVRQIVKDIDWPCEVKTLFREENLGCKLAVSSAIDWFFKNEDMGIILEDDCMPDLSFFIFCQELLERYKNEPRIGMISGDNFQLGNKKNMHSYYFTKYTHIWGWATWRDRWLNSYDVNISDWPNIRGQKSFEEIVDNKDEVSYWSHIFDRVHSGDIDTWDYQWALANLIKRRLNIMPEVNLISNIGFDENATHTTQSNDLANLSSSPINFPLSHPNAISRNINADEFTYFKYFRVPLTNRIRSKVISLLRKLFT